MKRARRNDRNSPVKSTRLIVYAFVIALCLGATYVVLLIVPKSTAIEIDVSAKRVSFSLPPETVSAEKIALLYSGMWVNAISLERFQPIELFSERLQTSSGSEVVANPLLVSPESLYGKVTFYSLASSISLQEVVCDSGSRINLQTHGQDLSLEIRRSHQSPYLILSFGESVGVSVQSCTVTDKSGRDCTQLFSNQALIRIHEMSRSLSIQGKNGELLTRIEMAKAKDEEQTRFIREQLDAQNLDFSKTIYGATRNIGESTIDSIFVKRNFPLENKNFVSERPGDLELIAKPERFVIYELSKFRNSLKVRAQGRFESLEIGQGGIQDKLVPSYVKYMMQHQSIAVAITWMVGLITLAVHELLKMVLKNTSEAADD